MAQLSATELAERLPANIKHLASLIARKPAEFTPAWASTVDEAFSLYTRTRTVNLLLALNDVLADFNWPFPAYIDLRRELGGRRGSRLMNLGGGLSFTGWGSLLHLRAFFARRLTQLASMVGGEITADGPERSAALDATMVRLFDTNKNRVFAYWRSHPLLACKAPIVDDLRRCYNERLWAACASTALPLLDFIMRDYLGAEDLRVSTGTLRNAFEKAAILPKDLKPGYAVWDGNRDPSTGNALATTLEGDLRLPGVFLSSFVEFANKYYGWYTVASVPPQDALNRHSIIHCASEYWSRENAVRLFTFLDLTLRVESALRILVNRASSDAPAA